MSLSYQKSKVLSNIEISEGVYRLHAAIEADVKPGQFFMLSAWEEQVLLPRPISIHAVDEKGLYFLYQVKGRGTKILSTLQTGEELKLLGPLGNGFEIDKIKGKVAVVAGGIGIAPMNYVIKSLRYCEIDLFCGFRNEVYGLEGVKDYIDETYIATDIGITGYKGYITDIFNPDKYDIVLCCGPEIMMNKIVAKCRENSVTVYVSTEKFMACGLGACLVCTCKTVHGNKRTCLDGPVFLGEELILDA